MFQSPGAYILDALPHPQELGRPLLGKWGSGLIYPLGVQLGPRWAGGRMAPRSRGGARPRAAVFCGCPRSKENDTQGVMGRLRPSWHGHRHAVFGGDAGGTWEDVYTRLRKCLPGRCQHFNKVSQPRPVALDEELSCHKSFFGRTDKQ